MPYTFFYSSCYKETGVSILIIHNENCLKGLYTQTVPLNNRNPSRKDDNAQFTTALEALFDQV